MSLTLMRATRRDDAPPWRLSAALQLSIQRESLRIPSAQVRGRVERLAVDRSIVVFARERWIPDRRREGVIGEFAVAGQYFGAGVEPGALGDVNSGARPLLIGDIGTGRAVIGPSPFVVLAPGLRARR